MELEQTEYNYEFRLGDYITEGWELFKKNGGLFVAYALVLFVIQVCLGLIPILGSIAYGVISTPLMAGFYLVAAKTSRNEPVEFGDFFQGFQRFLPLFLVSLVGGILISLGFFALIIPGIYLAVAWSFAVPIALWITDDFWKAMELSRKVVSKNWWGVFGFLIVIILINFAGMLACGVGLLVTVPLSYCAIYAAYKDVFKQDGSTSSSWTDPEILDSDYTN